MSHHKLPTLLDNDPEGGRTLLESLRVLLPQAQAWNIATGYFDVRALLALDKLWQEVPAIRLVMGDETTRQTKQILVAALQRQLEETIEAAKEQDDALSGLDAVRHALQNGHIQVRVFKERKFHAKAHHFIARNSPVNFAIVGSSNFTLPGLKENIELNLFTSAKEHVDALEQWFEEVWRRSEDVSDEALKVVERHLHPFSPFQVWAKALMAYLEGQESPIDHWEERESVVFPLLSQYQKDGYRQARAIADRWGGAFLCDGVGLGKTFIGAMLLEYHLHRGDRILILVPKSARSVWESRRPNDPVYLLRQRYRRAFREQVEIRNHTDLGREGAIAEDDLHYYREFVDVILIDEAHHFRTPTANRSKLLYQLCQGNRKKLYFLTATPVNNSLDDLYHLIRFFTGDKQDYFKTLGIQNLRRYFTEIERELEQYYLSQQGVADLQEAAQEKDILRSDRLLRALVIQRSRAYVKESEQLSANAPLFPQREKPQVIPYSLKKVYASLYTQLQSAFDRDEPLLSLAVYNPERFRKGKQDTVLLNRDRQIVGLIRTLLLKRLESSYKAFEASLEDLLRKMAAFVSQYAPDLWEQWRTQHQSLWETLEQHRRERQDDTDAEEGNEFDDLNPPALDASPDDYDLDALMQAVEFDMNLLARMLQGIYRNLSPQNDDKLQQLLHRLRADPQLSAQKVVVFTEFRDTARYLWRELQAQGFQDVEELDSTRNIDREVVIKRFAPYYNCTPDELPRYLQQPIRILISTDVLSEGLNLQDCNIIINYDLHWNPVRLMQRIGRVDRRLNPDIEQQLGRLGNSPLKVYVYNFLPPDELEELLRLYQRVTGKLLRISRTLGIEAPVLAPDEEYEALRLLNEKYEGQRSVDEQLHLELERLRRDYPQMMRELENAPKRMFSGKQGETIKGLFCCYRFPPVREGDPGETRWYFRTANGELWESDRLHNIADVIRSAPETPRLTQATPEQLAEWRKDIERRAVQRHMRNIQAPQGTKPTLICWMEVS